MTANKSNRALTESIHSIDMQKGALGNRDDDYRTLNEKSIDE